MTRKLIIDGQIVEEGSGPYVIAEIGHNHQGDIEKCKALFKAAKDAGASAVKLQKRNNRALFTKEMFDGPYNSENAYGPTYGTHREALEFGRDEYQELQRYAAELEITFFSTAFDIPSADFLQSLGMPAFKIASGDLKNTPLMRYVASFGKPMIISTGGGSSEDIERAYNAIMPINTQLCIMQCTSIYPTDYDKLNLRVIETLREKYPDIVIGLSSHDNGISMPLVGYILGAQIIEKHFTMDRTWKGTDHAFSLEPVGLRKLVRDLDRASIALGDGEKIVYKAEQAPLLKMGKKLVAARDLAEGTILTEEDITFKSPGDGLPPYELDKVIGARVVRSLAEDQNIDWDSISY